MGQKESEQHVQDQGKRKEIAEKAKVKYLKGASHTTHWQVFKMKNMGWPTCSKYFRHCELNGFMLAFNNHFQIQKLKNL